MFTRVVHPKIKTLFSFVPHDFFPKTCIFLSFLEHTRIFLNNRGLIMKTKSGEWQFFKKRNKLENLLCSQKKESNCCQFWMNYRLLVLVLKMSIRRASGGSLTTVHKSKMSATGGVKKIRQFSSLNPWNVKKWFDFGLLQVNNNNQICSYLFKYITLLLQNNHLVIFSGLPKP